FDERPAPEFNLQETDLPVQVAEAVHPRAEVEAVIQEILRLVREENYRFRDMAIFVRETEAYHDLLTTLFADYEIPVFIDEKRTMLNHPFIEFLRSLFDVVESNWRYDALFRLLKTGFIPTSDVAYPLTTDAIDLLENYVLEYGIRRKNQWLTDKEWIFQRFRGFSSAAQTDWEREMQAKVNSYRKQIGGVLASFDKDMKAAKTVRERAEVLFLFIEEIQLREELEKRKAAFDTLGEVEKVREEEQVWDAFLQLLDEMVEMIGEEELSLASFHEIMEAGLDALQFSHVPPSMDHVIV